MEPASGDDAHRRLEKSHNLAASLSYVETRQVRNDYTLRWDGRLYRIEPQAVTPGLRKANVRVEARLDGSLAVRHRDRYLPVKECAVADKPKAGELATPERKRCAGKRKSKWLEDFDLKKGPKIWQAAEASGARTEEHL